VFKTLSPRWDGAPPVGVVPGAAGSYLSAWPPRRAAGRRPCPTRRRWMGPCYVLVGISPLWHAKAAVGFRLLGAGVRHHLLQRGAPRSERERPVSWPGCAPLWPASPSRRRLAQARPVFGAVVSVIDRLQVSRETEKTRPRFNKNTPQKQKGAPQAQRSRSRRPPRRPLFPV